MDSWIEMVVLACLSIAFAGPFFSNLFRRYRRPEGEKVAQKRAIGTEEG